MPDNGPRFSFLDSADDQPEPALEVLQMIYTPLVWLFDQLDG
ncbi:MAG TPA: hypothetical protein VGN57_18495 [Pirellulaceae bacterium]|jgi:hypothetical protein|nr:hypothetical protein [Pirellulaceae bacterium]